MRSCNKTKYLSKSPCVHGRPRCSLKRRPLTEAKKQDIAGALQGNDALSLTPGDRVNTNCAPPEGELLLLDGFSKKSYFREA